MASPLYSKIYLQEIDQFPTVNIREKSSLASSKDWGGDNYSETSRALYTILLNKVFLLGKLVNRSLTF